MKRFGGWRARTDAGRAEVPPRSTLWERTPETAAKHQVLRGYLNAWFPIMGTKNERIALIDGFAGPGRYQGGEPGSPLIMLESLLHHRALSTITAEVVFVFIEESVERAAHLRSELEAIARPKNVTVEVAEGLFHELVGPLLDDIERKGRRLAPTFAFIDPFGYEDNRLELSSRILGFERCEVLMYVPLPHIARFLNAATVPAEALDRLFGDDRWRTAQGRRSSAESQRALHNLLRDRIGEYCKYVRSFEIVGSKANTGAHLFFGTHHQTGLARMKDSMWRADPAGGARFRDSTRAGQMALFDKKPDLELLEQLLRGHFGSAAFGIQEAVDYVVVDTPFLEAHIRRATLSPAEKEGRLEIVTAPAGRKRGTYPPETRMRFAEPKA